MECDTAAETVRVVKYEDTFPSFNVPQSYLENYNFLSNIHRKQSVLQYSYRGVIGGGGDQVELYLYPSDSTIVSRQILNLMRG